MSLQEQITQDMRKSLKEGTPAHRDALKVIVGEFQRQPSAKLSDEEVVKILKKLKKSEEELLTLQKNEGSTFLFAVNNYIPSEASREEIVAWISANIDFSKYKNKMQAMKDILAHFGGRTDGNTIKNILMANA